MLQQTQVKTVIPYFNNFINKYSKFKKTLANCKRDKTNEILGRTWILFKSKEPKERLQKKLF